MTLSRTLSLAIGLTAMAMSPGRAHADNWMDRLPDNAYVSVLSIPGAHDAATGSGWSMLETWGDRYAKTQELTIAEQWSIGIRAFDFRPCVYEDYMNLNHGIMATKLHFDDVLLQLRDSLVANPSEFVIIHMLHASDGDQVSDAYNGRIVSLLQDENISDFLVDFKPTLTVADMRGKILILSRDRYATTPIGGFFQNWTGEADWNKQTAAYITGPGNQTGRLYVQDFADTHEDGALETKVNAIKQMLRFSTNWKTQAAGSIRWIFNFMSAYSKVESLLGISLSTSEGYRDNAAHTNATLIDFLAQSKDGPTGIVLMDYVGTDVSEGYNVRGAEAVRVVIENNFRYLNDRTAVRPVTTGAQSGSPRLYTTDGRRVDTPRRGQIVIGNGQKHVAR